MLEHNKKVIKSIKREYNKRQFEIENRYAELIRQQKPFSKERQEMLQKAYEEVNRIMAECKQACNEEIVAFGANEKYFTIIDDVVERKLKRIKEQRQLRIFEAGVGTGFVLKHLRDKFGEKKLVELIGCDVNLEKDYLGDLYDSCIEEGVYGALSGLADNSIDIFYWNDVMEHLPEDEIDETIGLIYKKLSPEGIIITITPSRSMGPYDITADVNPLAIKPEGLHLHEYYFSEVYEIMAKHQLKPFSFVKRTLNGYVASYEQCAENYNRHAAKESFRLRFAYRFGGQFGKIFRKCVMRSFTDVTVFCK